MAESSKMETVELITLAQEALIEMEIVGLSQRSVAELMNRVFDKIGKALADNKKVRKVGFGTFEPRARADSLAPNPQFPGDRSKYIPVPAHKTAGFKVGNTLKETLNRYPASQPASQLTN